MKFILSGLFNFDMFSSDAWFRLTHSHLHGFGGFVFGILILAALPLYAATTTIILRTKKPLFGIPIPKFISSAFAPSAPPPAEPEPEPQKTEPATPIETFPADMPTELRGAFMRARRGGSRIQISAFDNSHLIGTPQPVMTPATNTTSAAATVTDTADDFPLPMDFETSDIPDTDISSIPSFTDISFDTTPDAPTTAATEPQKDGEFIIQNNNIIFIHNDPDFWIADDADWFASGKQRPSPIPSLKQRATETGMTPVIYLAETNILDLDSRIAEWESNGIKVITDLSDLK